MFKYIVIYNILFIPFLRGNTVPPSVIPEQKTIKNDLSHEKIKQVAQNVITEGGAIIPSNPIIQLKDHPTLLLNSEDELGHYKNKSVVGRKGVNYTNIDETSNLDTTSLNIPIILSNQTNNISTIVQPSKPPSNIIHNIDNSTLKLNVTKNHKPLILSHEALEKMDEMNNLDVTEDIPNIKIHSMKTGNPPAMIMPIVITILVVPMFAVVGYMALKRGQEAWKNRHYKRMDFLLDGMYNE